jgi:hypothetical protein
VCGNCKQKGNMMHAIAQAKLVIMVSFSAKVEHKRRVATRSLRSMASSVAPIVGGQGPSVALGVVGGKGSWLHELQAASLHWLCEVQVASLHRRREVCSRQSPLESPFTWELSRKAIVRDAGRLPSQGQTFL